MAQASNIGITVLDTEEYLPPGTEEPKDGTWEVEMSYDFDIPDNPIEQVVKFPTRVVTTEDGMFSTTIVPSKCGRCVRVDVAGNSSKELIADLLRKTIQGFIDDDFVLLCTFSMILELSGVLGAATYFRKPGVEKPVMLAMPDIELIEDFDQIDAEFLEDND